MKSVHTLLNADAIYARGYVTQEEANAVDLSQYAGKVRIIDDENDVESIWVAFITEEDRARYKNENSHGEEVRAVLLNHSLNFLPHRTWGRVITGKTNGNQTPIVKPSEQIAGFKATDTEYRKEYPDQQE